MATTKDVATRNAEFVRDFLAWQRHSRGRSRETLFIYTDVLQKLLDFIGSTPLVSVSVSTLESFVNRPRVRRQPHHLRGQQIVGSPATLRRDATIVRSLFRYLADRGVIGANPSL